MKNRKLPVGAIALTLIAVLVATAALVIPQPASESHSPKTSVADAASVADTISDPAVTHSVAGSESQSTTDALSSAPQFSSTGLIPDPTAANSPSASGTFGPDVRSMVVGSSSAPTAARARSADPSKSSVGDAGETSAANPSSYRTPAQILAGKDLADPAQRALAVAEMTQTEDARYQAVLAKAEKLGVPTRIEGPEGGLAIIYDFRGDDPLYRTTLNASAAISTGANLIRQTAPYNLNGEGIKVGVWDGGSVRNTHQEFSTNRVVKRNTTAANDDHATHVAGTIGATGIQANAKGMAPLAAIDSYDWNSDYAEMTSAGAASPTDPSTRIPISNHSYGYNATAADMGRYEKECNTTDALVAGLPYYLVFWAAGNEQQDYGKPFGGYQSITFNGLAKNVMTIGAADDAVTSGLRDVTKGTLATFSSMGPCDDGRIKPDIVANGVNVYSCVASSNTAYDGTYSGTSMATPNAAGSATLLQQLHKANFSGQLLRASMLKALLIHTADDTGRPGPDYQYGWGYMNVKAAADIILAHKANLAAPKLIENSINTANKIRTNAFVWDGSSPIRATLAWTDPAGAAQTATNSRTRNLVNDLDLKITAPDGTTTYLPYVMPFVGSWTTASMTNNAVRGTNRVDNVERIDIPAPTQAGTYTVTVGMYGTNALGGTNQTYSLVVTGGQGNSTPPPPPPPANTATFAAADVPKLVPDNNSTGITSTNNVTLTGKVSALTASVNVSHTYKGDLVVTLISPAGTSFVLHNRTGSSQDNVILVNVPVTAFNNTSAAGQWKLRVQDLARYDTGTLNSWSLTVTTVP